MQINHAIVHKLQKELHQESNVLPRQTPLEVNENLEQLVGYIITLYNEKTGRGYGKFYSDNVSYPFSKLLSDFQSEEVDTDFIAFTFSAMDLLKSRIDGEGLATGGYILFIEYEHRQSKIVLVVSLKDKDGFIFDDNLDLDNQPHIDLEHLHEMARIDTTKWHLGNEGRYLSFAKKRQNADRSFSRYFREFIGCDEFEEENQLTQEVVSACKAYAKFGPLSEERKLEILEITHNYMEEIYKSNGVFKVHDLATRLDPETPDRFTSYMYAQEIELSDGFKPNKSAYRGLKRRTIRDGTIALSFNASDLGKSVTHTEGEEFIRVKLSPEKIKELTEAN
ncbi:nucleoid-associated protein [Hydrogenovibrio thermophilus]|uniref:Nucleoid-associated protein n=1 Tax=Hydrogenovibrio thermophilus TaxID=265883 RepID=A0A410H190_9GAMM|nr:nucleoid-associated protein [Hydrogenovibrio thermophilus]QAB14431.1 nucleoid-associated protein [Hydrogenovibrio thermophilus]